MTVAELMNALDDLELWDSQVYFRDPNGEPEKVDDVRYSDWVKGVLIEGVSK